MTHFAAVPPLDPGVCVTLYDGSVSPTTMLGPKTRRLLTVARPEVVMVHCGPGAFDAPGDARAIVTELRALLPRVRVWFGVGVDGLTNQLAHGAELAAIERQLEGLARNAKAQSIEAIVWDQEAKGEAFPVPAAVVARTAIKITRELVPGIVQGFTSYDHPVAVARNADRYPAQPGERVVDHFGGHGRLPWDPWVGAGGVDFSAEQTYIADNPAKPAGPGALVRRQATSNVSFALLERQGRMRAGLPRVRYNQLWGYRGAQATNAELGSHLWCGWAAPWGSRCDLNGRLDVLGACELRRRGVRDVEAVKALQRELGVTADGVVGKITLSALGIRVEDWA